MHLKNLENIKWVALGDGQAMAQFNPPSAEIYSADLKMTMNYKRRDVTLAIEVAQLYEVPSLGRRQAK